MLRNLLTSSSTWVISLKSASFWLPMRTPQFRVKARLRLRRWMQGMGSTPTAPSLPYVRSSDKKSLVSMSKCGI